MVSIHIVPVIAYLIIRVIYFTFRFKRGKLYLLLVPRPETLALPDIVERATQTPRRYDCLFCNYAFSILIFRQFLCKFAFLMVKSNKINK